MTSLLPIERYIASMALRSLPLCSASQNPCLSVISSRRRSWFGLLSKGYLTEIPFLKAFEPPHDKTINVGVHPAKTQVRPVWSVLAVHMNKPWVLSYPLSAQRKLDVQADLSLRWAHIHFVGLIMRRLIYAYSDEHWKGCRIVTTLVIKQNFLLTHSGWLPEWLFRMPVLRQWSWQWPLSTNLHKERNDWFIKHFEALYQLFFVECSIEFWHRHDIEACIAK